MYTEQKFSSGKKDKNRSEKNCDMEFHDAGRLYIAVDKFDFLSS